MTTRLSVSKSCAEPSQKRKRESENSKVRTFAFSQGGPSIRCSRTVLQKTPSQGDHFLRSAQQHADYQALSTRDGWVAGLAPWRNLPRTRDYRHGGCR